MQIQSLKINITFHENIIVIDRLNENHSSNNNEIAKL